MQEVSSRRTSDTTMQLTQEEFQERRGFERRRKAHRRLIETSDENIARLASIRLGIAQRRQTHTAEENEGKLMNSRHFTKNVLLEDLLKKKIYFLH